jgi:TRAP-type transport system periplasmic protein
MACSVTRRSFLAGATALGLATPHVARAAVRIMRIGNNNGSDSHFSQGCRALAAAAAADPVLGSVLKVEVHDNSELGDELSMLNGCIDGTIDMALVSGSPIGNIAPEAGLLEAPFLFKDVAHARAALDGATGLEFMELLKTKNLNVLAWGENGLRHITANRPIRTPEDLRGLKLRVPQSDVILTTFLGLGADAKQISFLELREALRTGQVEAQENPISVIEAAKLQELQKYLSLTGHIYGTAMIVASSDLLEDLTEAQRAALSACAKQGAAQTRIVAEAAQRDGVGRLKAAGMVVVEPDVPAFVAASRPNLDALGKKYGMDRMQRLISAGA